MAQLNNPSSTQARSPSGDSFEWTPALPGAMPIVQPNVPADYTHYTWLQEFSDFPDSTLALPMSAIHSNNMAEVDNFNYTEGFTDLNLDAPRPTGPYNAIVNPDDAPANQRALVTATDANRGSASFDSAEFNSQPAANTSSGSTVWTKEHDNFLMGLKAQGLGYSAIQDEMMKEFGWTRNKNVLTKRFAVLKKRCKPQIKTRIVRDISKKLTPEIIKAVGKELEKLTSSGSNSIAAELEDLVPLKLPEFLENLAADVCLSLSLPAEAVDDDGGLS